MSRRELFGTLCAMVFLVNLARVLFAPLIQPAAADFDVTTASLGIVTSAAWVGSATPRIPTGYLLTRLSRHRVIFVTGALLVCASLFTAVSGTVTHLTVGAFLMGLTSGMYFIAANPLVSELFPDSVGSAIGIHGMSMQLAAVGAPLAVSAILLVGDWRLMFYCVAGAAALATVALVWAATRTTLPDAGSADRSLLAAGRAQWPIILTGFAFIGAAGFLWNGLFNLYGDYLEVAKDIDPGTARLLLSGMFAAGVPAFALSGRVADRVPYIPLLLTISTAFVGFVLALTVVEGLVAVAAVSLLLGYVIHSLFPAIDTYMLSSLPDRHRASGYALFSAAIMAAQAPGSGVVGFLVVSGVSYATAFRVLALLVAGIVVVLFALYRAGRLPAGGPTEETPTPTETLD